MLIAGGLGLRWTEVGPGEAKTARQVRIVLTPRPDADVRAAVLAATDPLATPPTALVYLPHLRAALGEAIGDLQFGRALGRVVAHEMVHALAPQRGHASRGIMQRQLTRRLLRAALMSGSTASRSRIRGCKPPKGTASRRRPR